MNYFTSNSLQVQAVFSQVIVFCFTSKKSSRADVSLGGHRRVFFTQSRSLYLPSWYTKCTEVQAFSETEFGLYKKEERINLQMASPSKMVDRDVFWFSIKSTSICDNDWVWNIDDTSRRPQFVSASPYKPCWYKDTASAALTSANWVENENKDVTIIQYALIQEIKEGKPNGCGTPDLYEHSNKLVPQDIFSKDCEIVEQLHCPCQLGKVPTARKLKINQQVF